MSFVARDYQVACRKAVLAAFKEYDSALVCMPTGTGKTVLFADIIKCMFPRRAIILAHRQELIWQAQEKVRAVTGFRVDVEMGEYKSSTLGRPRVVVSTIQTMTAGNDGGGRMSKFDPNEYGLVVVDEAHHATSPSYRRLVEYFRTNSRIKVLGVTATPDRADEEALGQVFETVAFDYEILDAIHDGWLVPVRQQMVQIQDLDFSSIHTTAGDLNNADLARVMEAEKPLLGVADATLEIAGDKRTLVFAASVAHAKMLCEIFNRYKPGVAAWVCGQTDKDERKLINSDLNHGKIQILCNCGTHTEGFDSPGVEIVVMARPTKSRSLYAQMVGRSTRPLPNTVDGKDSAEARRQAIAQSVKPSCLVVDFVGNSGRHKLITTADILGGKVSEAAIERAIARARQNGKPVQMDSALDEEEELLRKEEAEKRQLEEQRRRMKLVAKAAYKTQEVNPFDLLQIRPVKERGWDKDRQLSEKQRNFLRRSGVDPDKMPFSQAKQLINEMMARFKNGQCTIGQAKVLKKFGYDTNMSYDTASATITTLKANGWKRPSGEVVTPAQPALPKMPPPRRSVAKEMEQRSADAYGGDIPY